MYNEKRYGMPYIRVLYFNGIKFSRTSWNAKNTESVKKTDFDEFTEHIKNNSGLNPNSRIKELKKITSEFPFFIRHKYTGKIGIATGYAKPSRFFYNVRTFADLKSTYSAWMHCNSEKATEGEWEKFKKINENPPFWPEDIKKAGHLFWTI